jgi:uncharacterized membrane protein
MNDRDNYITITKDPKTILAMFQIFILISTIIYVFAIMRTQVESNQKNIEFQQEQIQQSRDRADDTFVRKDVFNQQYRSIIEKLDELKMKLEER